jgi:hypothetical protein
MNAAAHHSGLVECHRDQSLQEAFVAEATSAQVVYGRLAAPSCDRYAARFDFVSSGSGAGSETGAGLSTPSTVR